MKMFQTDSYYKFKNILKVGMKHVCICVYVYIHTYVHIYVCVFVVWLLSHVQLFASSWIVAHQATLSIGFPRQEYWSGLLFSSPGYVCVYIYVSFWSNTKFVNMYCVVGYTDLFLMSKIYIKV